MSNDLPRIDNELEVLSDLVPLDNQHIIELGCGSARLLRDMLVAHPTSQGLALEVDERQHAKNLTQPQDRLTFAAGGAQAIAQPDASFDLALMLKSLHHVPMPLMDQALAEVARVLRPGGYLYVSEPVYEGEMNEVVRLFNDEGVVRAAAQRALDAALNPAQGPAQGPALWQAAREMRFMTCVSFRDFADFELRMMRPTFADHQLDDAKVARVRAAFEPHMTPTGVDFVRPMHVRLLRRTAALKA
jgi:SAM-dependent methyltransferase